MKTTLYRARKWRNPHSWVYGDYYENPFTGEHYIKALVEGGTLLEDIRVIPDTVGQYIGLRDIKKKYIFEGQPVRFKYLPGLYNPIRLEGVFVFGSDLSYEINITNSDEYSCLHYVSNGQFYDFEAIED